MIRKVRFVLAGLAAIVVLLAIGLFVWPRYATEHLTTELMINEQPIIVERATIPTEWQRGLSGRPSLSINHGLWFVFGEPDRHGIWMKDMLFPIDVLWLDAAGRVTYLVDDMDPMSYPTVYRPAQPAFFVLELDDQAIERLMITEGTVVEGL